MKTLVEAIEGTGEEISRYAGARPQDRFLVVNVQQTKPTPAFDEARWNETLNQIESLRGLFQELPDEAYGTEALYD